MEGVQAPTREDPPRIDLEVCRVQALLSTRGELVTFDLIRDQDRAAWLLRPYPPLALPERPESAFLHGSPQILYRGEHWKLDVPQDHSGRQNLMCILKT